MITVLRPGDESNRISSITPLAEEFPTEKPLLRRVERRQTKKLHSNTTRSASLVSIHTSHVSVSAYRTRRFT
jgi:hypothetical protein